MFKLNGLRYAIRSQTEGFQAVVITVFFLMAVAVGWAACEFSQPKYHLPPGWRQCIRDFREGVTTREELQQVLGGPSVLTRWGDLLELSYPYYDYASSGCIYTFDKLGKLQRIGVFQTVE